MKIARPDKLDRLTDMSAWSRTPKLLSGGGDLSTLYTYPIRRELKALIYSALT